MFNMFVFLHLLAYLFSKCVDRKIAQNPSFFLLQQYTNSISLLIGIDLKQKSNLINNILPSTLNISSGLKITNVTIDI